MSARLALRGLRSRPLRSLLTALAIVVGVATVVGALSFTGAMRSASDALTKDAYGTTDAVVTATSAFTPGEGGGRIAGLDGTAAARVATAPGVRAAVAEVTDFDTKVLGDDGEPLGEGPYFGVGVDGAKASAAGLTPFRLQDGRWPAGAGQVAIDRGTAEDQGLAVGDRVRVDVKGPAREFTITGLVTFGSVEKLGMATVALFDLPTAQAALGRGDEVDQVLVRGDGRAPEAFQAALGRELGASFSVRDAADQDRFTLDVLSTIVSVLTAVLTAFGVIVLLVGGFTIANALSLAVAQRTAELGVLRALGAGRGVVRRSVVLEGLALGAAGAALGIALGALLARGLKALFDALGLGLPMGEVALTSGAVTAGLALGIGVTAVAALVPAWRATRVTPMAALRAGQDGSGTPGVVGRAVAALTGLVGRPGTAFAGLPGRLARRNAQRRPGRTLATAGALVVGVTLVVLVSVLGTGLKQETRDSIEGRVSAAHVVTATDGWSPVDAQAVQAVAGAEGVTTVTGIRQDRALAFGDEETVNAVDGPALAEVFAFEQTAGPGDALATLGRDGAIVDEGFAAEHGLEVGSRFAVTAAGGTEVPLVVRAVETSPVLDVLSLGPVTMSRQAYDAAFTNDQDRLVLVEGGSEAGMAAALRDWPAVQVQTTSAWVDELAEELDPLMGVLVVLLLLAVLVSLFGIANTMVLATVERTPEIGMLRAVGMSRRGVRRMVRREAVTTALLGAGIGIPAGLGLGWLVATLLADEGLAFAVPAGTLVAVAVVSALAGAAAAALPARRAARMDPLAALAAA